ncbi:UDP-glucosyltransferase 2-like [Procambarus clarkii]|uniref:UDP-glucosyltransferase 2-like n=1 Tax=Procambarus clarkii TaxID=6728 RepID=UPI0037448531
MMKVACMVVSVAVLLLLSPAPLLASDLLLLTPFGSRSVRSLFSVLTEGLVARGHTVTLVSSGDPVPSHPNVTHVLSPHSALDHLDLFEVREDGALFRLWMKIFPAMARELYSDPKVMDLWHDRHKFDAIIINSAANEMAFPFLLDRVAPFITLAPVGTEPLQLAYLGNVVSPAVLPSVIVSYDNTLTLWERLVNTLATVFIRYSFRRVVGSPLATALRDTFPELPDPFELYPQQALALLNQHHLLDGSVPLLPNQVEVGCMHCRPAGALPPVSTFYRLLMFPLTVILGVHVGELRHDLPHYITECPVIRPYRPIGMRYLELCNYFIHSRILKDILTVHPKFASAVY